MYYRGNSKELIETRQECIQKLHLMEERFMVRLTTIGNFLSGIGLTLLGFTIIVKFILDSVSATPE